MRGGHGPKRQLPLIGVDSIKHLMHPTYTSTVVIHPRQYTYTHREVTFDLRDMC